ncbi:aminotransferase class I/II-fold pyridoxal phosphate-dependent enzyme [Thermodesulfobacteriota bacterium]
MVNVKDKVANRIKSLPPYLFAEIDRKKNELKKKGVDIISLGIGDPDLKTPHNIIQALKKASEDVNNHHYPDYEGLLEFREAVATWYKNRFDIALDPETEVVSLIGSKEGIAHIPMAFINSGDIVLTPDPAYPVYKVATMFAGGEAHFMPLRKENDFMIDLDAIDEDVLKKAKLMFLNYPNNPTAAVADDAFLAVLSLAWLFWGSPQQDAGFHPRGTNYTEQQSSLFLIWQLFYQ